MSQATATASPWLTVQRYLAVARVDHWFKNILVVPGMAAAVLYVQTVREAHQSVALDMALALRCVAAIVLACFVASANYILNEVLDGPYDAKHPTKRHRPVPSGQVSVPVLLAIAALLVVGSLSAARFLLPPALFWSLATLFIFGLVYNVPPVRAKDLPYVDVVCESANNPIRLLIGWFAVGAAVAPPISLLVCYWSLGAFLMTAKRYAEMRAIGDQARAAAYRKSFRYYTSESLLLAMITYISAFMYCYGFISVRYKIELLFTTPLMLMFIAWFFHLAFRKDSIVKEPEKVIREPGFLAYSFVTFAAVLLFALADFGWLWKWLSNLHIGIPIG